MAATRQAGGLGVKKFGGETVLPGNIIVRQRGKQVLAGQGLGVRKGPHDICDGSRKGRVHQGVQESQVHLGCTDSGGWGITGRSEAHCRSEPAAHHLPIVLVQGKCKRRSDP